MYFFLSPSISIAPIICTSTWFDLRRTICQVSQVIILKTKPSIIHLKKKSSNLGDIFVSSKNNLWRKSIFSRVYYYTLRYLWFIMITNKSAENGQKMAWLTPPTFVCLSIEVEKASRPSSFLSFFCISTVRILLWWFLLFEYNSNSLPCSSVISIAKPKSFFSNCFNKRIAMYYFLSKKYRKYHRALAQIHLIKKCIIRINKSKEVP